MKLFPKTAARTLGLSIRLARLVLGLNQQQAGELLGISSINAKVAVGSYESGESRPSMVRLPAIITLLERACIYAAEHFGPPITLSKMPAANDPDYALKLFRYWQANDGTLAGLKRIMPYLGARPDRRRWKALPGPNGIMHPDDLEVRLPHKMKARTAVSND